MKITKEVLEAHLNCKFKGHLKLAVEVGTRSDYEAMTTAAGWRRGSRPLPSSSPAPAREPRAEARP